MDESDSHPDAPPSKTRYSPTVSQEEKAVEKALDARGVVNKCPFCSSTDWWSLDNVAFPYSITSATSGRVIPTYIRLCGSCGFIRMHAKDIVDGVLPYPQTGYSEDEH